MTREEAIKELDTFGIDPSVGLEEKPHGITFYANDNDGNEYSCQAYTGKDGDIIKHWEAFVGDGTEVLSEDTAQGLFDAILIWAEENTDA